MSTSPFDAIDINFDIDDINATFNGYGLHVVFGLTALVMFLIPSVVTDVYTLNLIAWGYILAILALGYNVIFGYTGLLSFGHAAFFGTGAYTVAFLMKYLHVDSLLVLIGSGGLVALVIATVFGAVSLRSHDVYYALLMLAMAQILYVSAVKWYSVTNGTEGMTIEQPSFLGVSFADVSLFTFLAGFYYYFIVTVFLLSIAALWVMMRSSFGLTLKSIRENEARARAVGVPVSRYKLYGTLVSGFFPGIAGAMFAIQQAHITPSILHWTFSGEILFMTLLGGASSFVGPIIGGLIFILLRTYAVSLFTEYWQFTMGAVLFLVVVLLGSDGLWGGAKRLVDSLTTGGDRNE